MVSSQGFSLAKPTARKSLLAQLQLAIPPTGPESVDLVGDFEFDDIFGSPPSRPFPKSNFASPINTISELDDPSEKVFEDPVVVCLRSHSLVGPTSRVSQVLQLNKLTIHESESSADLMECVSEESAVEVGILLEAEGCEKAFPVGTEICQGVGLDDFEIMKLVGQGAFGKVYQVRMKGTSEIYAMKVMRKDKITEKNHAEYMKAERDILTIVDHPFIVQLRYSFQTKYRLYLVLDFMNGGHLFFQLYHKYFFTEDLARIYTAEIVSAVSHLHENGIMHRDLKPENILLDADGHVMLTDFGLAKQFDENTRSNSLCGTVEYMAPEIVLGKGHDKAADWWSVGILVFEMLTGKPPFMGGNREKIHQKIIKEKMKLPSFLSSEAHSLLKGLLNKEASKRLGCGPGGSLEIKNHKWFKSINWRKLEAREIQPNFRPEVAGKHCVANFEEKWTKMPLLDSPISTPVGASNFSGFSYVRPSPLHP